MEVNKGEESMISNEGEEHRTLKKPTTATSLSAITDSTSSTEVRVETVGPVLFFSQVTMSSACLPAATT